MSTHKHITIGGVQYDPQTGLRVEQPVHTDKDAKADRQKGSPAHAIHKKAARTQTLSRSHVKGPSKQGSAARASVKKSSMIQKFAPQGRTVDGISHHRKTTKAASDIGPVKHPVQHKLAQRKTAASPVKQSQSTHVAAASRPSATKQAAPQKPAHQVKQESIAKALHTAKPHKAKKTKFLQRHPRLLSVGSAGLAIVMLAGYFTYINLPSISVRVASAQAGIAAHYPSYQPSGYRLDGPVAFSEGKVTMKFAANVGPQSFVINQAKSNWDSSALLENYVKTASSDNYQTYNDNGLTIYAYDSGAAWVNGGILHTIDSDAALSSDQVRRIATSL